MFQKRGAQLQQLSAAQEMAKQQKLVSGRLAGMSFSFPSLALLSSPFILCPLPMGYVSDRILL